MDYSKLIKRLVAKLNENKTMKDITVYDVMFLLGLSQYTVAKAVLIAFERLGFIKKEGSKYIIVDRVKKDNLINEVEK